MHLEPVLECSFVGAQQTALQAADNLLEVELDSTNRYAGRSWGLDSYPDRRHIQLLR